MKSSTTISILVAVVLAFTSASSFAQQGQRGGAGADRAQQVDRDRGYDRDRMGDRDRTFDHDRRQDRDRTDSPEQDRDRDRLQDPANLGGRNMYGNELMTPEEREKYRNEFGGAETQEEREQIRAEHMATMQQRALQQGVDLVPPGQGPIYGGELMTVQERNQFREQLRLTDSETERQQLQAQHREQMRERAHALNIEIEEAE